MPNAAYHPDDYQINDWVTIRDEPDDEVPSFLDDEPAFIRRMRREPSGPRAGMPLRIIGVHLPHVYVAVLDGDGDEVGPAILDVRKHHLVRLAAEIPAAIIAFGRKKRDDAAEREAEESRRKAIARANAEVARRRAFGNDTPTGQPLDIEGGGEGSADAEDDVPRPDDDASKAPSPAARDPRPRDDSPSDES